MASDVMSLKYDRDGEYLALGAKNGSKILYSLAESNDLSMQTSSWPRWMT